MKAGKRTLFGTDGIRGMAGSFPLDEATTRIIGRALGHYLARSHAGARVVMGEDTRESSRWITATVAAGLNEAGVAVESAGVLTTPGVAYLARMGEFAAGVVISASHNPWTDNGIKVFGHDGYKLADAAELEIEHEIFELIEKNNSAQRAAAALAATSGLHQAYVEWLAGHWNGNGKQRKALALKIVAD